MKKICFFGNCQAQHMASLLMAGSSGYEILWLPPVFKLTKDDQPLVESAFQRADFIFAQRTNDDFQWEWARSSQIKSLYPEKTLTWPVIYFDGYFPGVRYFYPHQKGRILNSPLIDYHFDQVIESYKRGETVKEALEQLEDKPFSAEDPFEASFRNLEMREEGLDICVSNILRESAGKTLLFMTPNHPINPLLSRVISRLASKAGMNFNESRSLMLEDRLDEVIIPILRHVRWLHKLNIPYHPTYRGKEITAVNGMDVSMGGTREYSGLELVEAFFRIYDSAIPR